MLMDKHRSIIIFTLRQPIGWLNWYHPSIGYIIFFQSCASDKQGSTTISLMGYPNNCWIKRNGYHPMMDLFVSTTLMFLLGWYPLIYLWYKTTKTIPDDHYFFQISPLFLRLYHILYHISFKYNVQLWVLPNSGCRNLHLALGNKNDDILGAWWGIA